MCRYCAERRAGARPAAAAPVAEGTVGGGGEREREREETCGCLCPHSRAHLPALLLRDLVLTVEVGQGAALGHSGRQLGCEVVEGRRGAEEVLPLVKIANRKG